MLIAYIFICLYTILIFINYNIKLANMLKCLKTSQKSALNFINQYFNV